MGGLPGLSVDKARSTRSSNLSMPAARWLAAIRVPLCNPSNETNGREKEHRSRRQCFLPAPGSKLRKSVFPRAQSVSWQIAESPTGEHANLTNHLALDAI